jgi:hypothetical protein
MKNAAQKLLLLLQATKPGAQPAAAPAKPAAAPVAAPGHPQGVRR